MAILAGFTCTLLLGGWSTLRFDLAVGLYSVLVFMTQRLLWPLTEVAEVLDLYQRGRASAARILGLLVTMDAVQGADLLELMNPRVTVPIHFDDYSVFRSPLDDFRREVGQRASAGRITSEVRYVTGGDVVNLSM